MLSTPNTARAAATRQPLAMIVDEILAGGNRTVDRAETLPPAAYVSEAFHTLEVERIFKSEWLCVGHVSQVAAIGDYFTIDMLGELLVVVRGPDRIRVISRVCLHRWAPVATGSGNTRIFSCPFHKWGYGLDGQLLGAPFMERADGFDPKSCRLPEIRSEIVEALGLIFITFSDTIGAIGERLGTLSERLRNWHLDELVPVCPSDFRGAFNWKILIETGQECYHHFSAHATTFEVNYPTKLSWVEDSHATWSVCHSPPRPDLADEDLTIGLPIFPDLTPEERRVFGLYWIYPTTRLAVFTDRVRLQLVIPVGPTATYARNVQLVRPDVAAQSDLVETCFAAYDQFTDTAVKEDVAIDIMQQRGALSALTRPGRLSHLEGNIRHLAEYIREKIAAT